MAHYNRSRGFTLIELLVVIAIIGILSAVVLASLNTARSKGNDAAIQSNLSAVRVQAEIYYGSTASLSPTYGGGNTYGITQATCAPTNSTMWIDPIIVKAIAASVKANGGVAATCSSRPTSYAIQVKLTAPTPTAYWCVDSSGQATQSTSLLATGADPIVCP